MPESDTTQITTGELNRAVSLIRTDIRDVKKDISDRPTKSDLNYANDRIRDLEDWQKWAMRIGVPALLGVIINTINTLNGNG